MISLTVKTSLYQQAIYGIILSMENFFNTNTAKPSAPLDAQYDDLKDNAVVPRFITGEEKKLASNERGTAYHRVMECLDYSRSINIDGVKQDIQQMLDTGRMTRIQAESINPYDINTFVQSEIGQRVSKAEQSGKAKREQPFVFECDGQLVQGVIDLYIEEEDGIVIVDYKTDRIRRDKSGEDELVKRYAVQLDYYAKALEQLTGKKVKEKVIYSFALGKGIVC